MHWRCSWSQFRWKTGQSGPLFSIFPSFSSLSQSFLIERLLGCYWTPWQLFLIFQEVRRCRRCASAPFAARLVFYEIFVHIIWVLPHSDISFNFEIMLKIVQKLGQTLIYRIFGLFLTYLQNYPHQASICSNVIFT